jgi:hypothetical protein
MPRRLNALHRILAKLPWIPSEPPAMARSSILVQRPRERNAGPDRKKGGPSSPPGPVVTRSSVCERADAVLTLTKLVMISVALGRSAVSNCLTFCFDLLYTPRLGCHERCRSVAVPGVPTTLVNRPTRILDLSDANLFLLA